MMKWFKPLSIVVVMLLSAATYVYSASEVLTFDSESLRERYANLTFELRCPKCQNQNVADSNSPISEDIRHKTYEMLHQGYTDQEIIDFMIDRYTEFVIYKPQMSIVTIWLWLLPALIFVFGFIILLKLTQRTTIEEPSLTEDEAARLKSLMEDKS